MPINLGGRGSVSWSDYADADVPHYWLISFDKVGALTIERYALSGRKGRYTHNLWPVAVDIGQRSARADPDIA
ncbi:hypothetical protein [Nocardia sp. CA-120079]|uniref:hypothetical protein n=1 Tax=Nocardia sp. CA-120079 TaxID=3239974 RepID=UPI003D975761